MATIAPLVQRMELHASPYIDAMNSVIETLNTASFGMLDVAATSAAVGGSLAGVTGRVGALAGATRLASAGLRSMGLENTLLGKSLQFVASASTLAAASLTTYAIGNYAAKALGYLKGEATLLSSALAFLRTPAGIATVSLVGLGAAAGVTAYAGFKLFYAGTSLVIRGATSIVSAAARAALALGNLGASLATSAAGYARWAALASGAGLAALVVQGFRYANSLQEVAQRLGSTTQEMAAFRLAAAQSNVDVSALESGLTRMQVRIGQAASGNAAAAESFAALGLSAQSLTNLSGGAQFETLVRNLAAIDNPAQRAAAAVKVFGAEGTTLAAKLPQLAAGMAQAGADAVGFGLALSGVESGEIDAAGNSLQRVWSAVTGLGVQIASGLAPYIAAAANAVADFAARFQLARKAGEIASFAVIEGARFVGDAWDAATLGVLYFEQGLRTLGLAGLTIVQPLVDLLSRLGSAVGSKSLAGLSDSAKQFAVEMAKAGVEAQDQIDAILSRSQTTGDQFAASLSQIDNNARKAAEGAAALGVGLASIPNAAAEASEADRLMANLSERVATWGMTANQVELYKLQMAGAGAETIKAAQAMQDQLDLFAKFDAGRKIMEDMATPLEGFQSRVAELQDLLRVGAIDWQTYERAIQQAAGQVDGLNSAASQSVGVRANTDAALRAQRQQREGAPVDRAAELAKKALDEAKLQTKQQVEQTKLLNKIATAPAGGDVIPSAVG